MLFHTLNGLGRIPFSDEIRVRFSHWVQYKWIK